MQGAELKPQYLKKIFKKVNKHEALHLSKAQSFCSRELGDGWHTNTKKVFPIL
jgi:hypothetical protein